MAVMAVIFDFDDTLLPDSTSANDAQRLGEQGFDPPLAYLNLLLDEVRPGGRLEGLTNGRLRDFGATLDSTRFEGLRDMIYAGDGMTTPPASR